MFNRIVASLTCLALLASISYADDWPMFRGAKRDNISTETGLLKKWPADGPKLLWDTAGMGAGYASVAVVDGKIYTTGALDGKSYLICLDSAGKIKWKKPYGKFWAEKGGYAGTRSTPAVAGGKVYIMSAYGEVICFDAKTGKEKWKVDTLAKLGGKNVHWGIAESVLVDDGKVICTPGGSNAVVALDAKTGNVAWKSSGLSDNSGYCSAVAVKHGSKKIILTMTAKNIVCLNAKSGKVLWTHPQPTSHGVNPNTPIYKDGYVFCTSGYNYGSVLLKLSKDASSAKQVYKIAAPDVHHGGAVLVGDHIYATTSKNKPSGWHCIVFKTGKTIWTDKSIGKGSLTYADGMLFGYSEKGKVGLIKASPKGYSQAGEIRIKKGKKEHWAHPVVSGGVLYIRHGDVLMAYKVK